MKNERYAFILVADEKYWNKLCERSNSNMAVHAFVRKNQVAPKAAEKLLFYVKKPVMQVRGTADFIERLTGPAEELWSEHGGETCFESFEEYCDFAQGRLEMTFVRFKNFGFGEPEIQRRHSKNPRLPSGVQRQIRES
jgi:hypothetical protein